jgi:Protein of unknown function (DUF3551)
MSGFVMSRFNAALLAGLAIASLTIFMPPAAANEYPWCAQYGGNDGDGGRNCGFVSREQCMETIRGMGGFCEPNLFYAGRAERPTKPPRKREND